MHAPPRSASASASRARGWTLLLLVAAAALASAELVPPLVSAALDVNYGATGVGMLHQYLNEKVMLAYWSWLAFDALLALAIVSVATASWVPPGRLGAAAKVGMVAALLAIAYLLVYPILVPVNLVLMAAFRNPPFLTGADARARFPAFEAIEAGHADVRAEFDRAAASGAHPPCIERTIPGFQVSTPAGAERCWRTIVLKKQGAFVGGAREAFPRTCALIDDAQVQNAIFSILDARVGIPPHIGYYKGFLRYHLGVRVPEAGDGRGAFLVCGGQAYRWREGEGVLFDDMFTHRVENPTDGTRVVLYLDVLRTTQVPRRLEPLYRAANAYVETHPAVKWIVKAQHISVRDGDARQA